MTVSKAVSSTKTKKKSSASSSVATETSSSTQQVSKTSQSVKKVAKETTTSDALSMAASSSSLQIADVSDLPLQTNIVTYTVTETLPQETGEKVTTYSDSGATSTEYRHFIAQDVSSKQSSNITQISSILNQSTQNLSKYELVDDASSSYTVIEPKEERINYNKNDSAWNGKFVHEQPVNQKSKTASESSQIIDAGTSVITEQSSISSSHQQSSAVVKSSSSSKVIEFVDGKERTVDQKHQESAYSAAATNTEYLSSKSGSNIVPEVHYSQKTKDTVSAYDTSIPDLIHPKTESIDAVKETHHVGDSRSTSVYEIRDSSDSTYDIPRPDFANKTSEKKGASLDTFISKDQDSATTSKSKQQSSFTASSESKLGNTLNSFNNAEYDDSSTVTTTTTYYDSKGNIINTVADSQTQPDQKTTSSKQATNGKTDILNTTYIVDDTSVASINVDNNQSNYSMNENYADTSRAKLSQNVTDSRNFYGHGVDSASTIVKNVYDSKAVQNTIGTKGRIIRDNTIDSTDIVYSNERNYGKTGWNGKFVYEAPTKPQRSESPDTKRPVEKESTSRNTGKSVPDDKRPKNLKTVQNDGKTVDSKIVLSKDSGSIRKDKFVSDSRTFIDSEVKDTLIREGQQQKSSIKSYDGPRNIQDSSYSETIIKNFSDITDIKDSASAVTNVEYTVDQIFSNQNSKTSDIRSSTIETVDSKFHDNRTSKTTVVSSDNLSKTVKVVTDARKQGTTVESRGFDTLVQENIININDVVSLTFHLYTYSY